MKKLRKVCLITLFVLLIIVIATSKKALASDLTVEENTGADSMIDTLQSNGSIWITNHVMHNNSNIFCRDYMAVLPDDGARYTLDDSNPITYSSTSEDINERIIAYILSRTNENSTYTKRNKQIAYWTALGQYNGNEDKSLYEEAKDYAEFIDYYKNNPGVQVDKSQAVFSDNVYGPIKIQYNYKKSRNVDFGGFQYQALDDNENIINEQVELCTKNSDGQGYTKINETTSGEYKVVTTDETGQYAYNACDLYLRVNAKTNKIKLKFNNNNAFSCNATIYNIKGTFDYSTIIYCMSCQSKIANCITSVDDNGSKDRGTILKYGNEYFELKSIRKYTTWSSSSVNDKFYIEGKETQEREAEKTSFRCVEKNYNRVFTTEQKLLDHIENNWANHFDIEDDSGALVQSVGTRGIPKRWYKCKKCYATFDNSIEAKEHLKNKHAETEYRYGIYTYSKFKGCQTATNLGTCGSRTSGTSEAQKLMVVKSSTVENIISEEISIEIQKIPGLKIFLEKYNTNGTKQLNRAKFTIQAKQIEADGTITNLVITEQDGNGICRIVPKDKDYPIPTVENPNEAEYLDDRVYVMISENTAPNGYSKLKRPICIRYNLVYVGGGFSWYPTYAPSWDEWKDLNFPAYGQWTWLEDEDTTGDWSFPNPYQSDKEDKILVNESVIEGADIKHIIRVYDRAKIDKISLLKVDADSENGNTPLAGAEFTATLKNVKSFKFGDSIINNNNPAEPITYPFVVPEEGLIINDVEFVDEDEPIEITLKETKAPEGDKDYYFKKLEGPITITLKHIVDDGIGKISEGTITYQGTTETINNNNLTIDTTNNTASITIPNLRLIDLSGKVWLDGNTGVKPVEGPDGKYTEGEKLVSNVLVKLADDNTAPFDNTTATYTGKTRYTNEQGQYSFTGLRWNQKYEVTFNYDGIHYIALNSKKGNENAEAYRAVYNETYAMEDLNKRTSFNNEFKTIMYGQSGTGVKLDYDFIEIEKSGKKERKSTLKTLDEKNTAGKLYPTEINNHLEMGSVKDDFKMTANITNDEPYRAHTTNLNLGLVGRGTDLALYTNVYQADVTINGQTTTYNYDTLNKDKFNLDVDLENQNLISSQTSDENNLNDYSLYLYSTDYSYRIRNYISSEEFIDDYNAEGAPDGSQTGDELKVYVTYRLQLENQTKTNSTISKVLYSYDDRYALTGIYYLDGGTRHYLEEGKDYHKVEHYELTRIEIEKDFEFKGYDVETLYLEFQIINFDEARREDPYLNFAEIIEYQTENGLIDVDSAPGNTFNENINIIEDDYDEANGIFVQIKDENRSIEGYVWDDTNKNGKRDENEPLINDVIVQLIELKEINGTNYEYIWQETKSGSKAVKRVGVKTDANGNVIWDNYSHSEEITDGQYKFEGFIPGDYIIRFIYGDGTTYDLTNNVIKYNGQDYKSSVDSKYNKVWYNTAGYDDENANNARDNEARRLETMAWSAEVDAKTGILLKLLDARTVDALNVVEKETLKAYYNEKYDPDVNEIGNTEIAKLLKDVTLANTWMCAETSKIKVPVEAENLEGEDNTIVDSTIKVNGIETNYKYEFNNVGLGLVKRPETNIELSKKLKQMTVIASNGQTILSAYLDENGNLQRQTDSLTVIPGSNWTLEVYQTDVNTVLDGANLEFIYDISVTNNSESDLLSKDLMELYNSTDINTYKKQLATYSGEVKTAMRSANNSYTLGAHLGSAYYTGIADSENSSKVLTEVTNIYDYINNELEPKAMTGLKVAGSKEHYLYADNYSLQKATINNVLEAEVTTGKMAPTETVTKYSVTLAKDPLSATGTLNFKNYIAEVMSYSNAAGRRATTSTPGNAEAVNKNTVLRAQVTTLEPDEASAEEINLDAAPGGDEKTVYVWLAVITIAVAVTATGTFVIKKYIVK